jgi:NarL family two-component system response regulator LiaR
MKKIRILVVDDETVVREGFVAILSFQSDFEVVAEAKDGIQAVELARKAKPDVILLDIAMPRQDGLTTIPILQKVVPETRILVLTSFQESDEAFQAIKAGALGFLLKDSTRVQLVQAIRDVADGKASIQPSVAMKVIQEMDNPTESEYTSDPLTPRELDTLRLIARGLSNQEIAQSLGVHERTIAKYVSNILNKLHLANRTQVALYAIREGLADETDEEKNKTPKKRKK